MDQLIGYCALALLHLSLGKLLSESEEPTPDLNTAEALRRWKAGGRVLNANWFDMRGSAPAQRVFYRGIASWKPMNK